MKRTIISTIILLLIGVFSLSTLMAQAPEAMYYQAEARGPHGEAVPNKNLEVKITIRADTPNGAVCWVGFHDVRTDQFGMFSLIIGEGSGGSYNFSTIDWANHSHYLNVKVYYKNTWTDMGTTQFLSVPYALHAKTAETALLDQVEDADADPFNELQELEINGNNLSLSLGNSVTLPASGHQLSVPILFSGNCSSGAAGIFCLDQIDFNTAQDYLTIDPSGEITMIKGGFYQMNISVRIPGTSASQVEIRVNGIRVAVADSYGNSIVILKLSKTLMLQPGDILWAYVPKPKTAPLSWMDFLYLGPLE